MHARHIFIFKKTIKFFLEKIKILYWINFPSSKDNENSKTVLFFLILNQHWFLNLLFYSFILKNKGFRIQLVIEDELIENIFFKRLFYFSLRIKKITYFRFLTIENNFNSQVFWNHDLEKLKNLAIQNFLYNHRIEFTKNVFDQNRIEIEKIMSFLDRWSIFLDRNFKDSYYHKVIIPSGLIMHSSLILDFFRKKDIDVFTIETYSFTTAQRVIGKNIPAVHDHRHFRRVIEADIQKDNFVKAYLRTQISPVEESEKIFKVLNYQTSNTTILPDDLRLFLAKWNTCILLAPNSIGDSAMMFVKSPFENQLDWLVYTIEFMASRNFACIIRFHPKDIYSTNYNLFQRVKSFVDQKNYLNVYLISPLDNVNTFSFIQNVTFACVWVSTIAADLAIRGIPVINAAKPIYSGFSQFSESLEQYKINLLFYLENIETPSFEKKEAATNYIFETFKLRPFRMGDHELIESVSYWSLDLKNYNPDFTLMINELSC
jgi:hypothetical protein